VYFYFGWARVWIESFDANYTGAVSCSRRAGSHDVISWSDGETIEFMQNFWKSKIKELFSIYNAAL